MRIVFLNGSLKSDEFDDGLYMLRDGLTGAGHVVHQFDLRSLKIPRCTGCFGCWVKTPGMCVSNDPSREISGMVVHSDLVIFASPLIMGFPSAVLKNVNDKLIQVLHPYVVIDQKEMHHRSRYHRYPKWGLFLGPEADTDDEDIAVVRRIYERAALNFKTTLAFACTSSQPISEVLHEIIGH